VSFIAASRWSPSAGCAARALYGWEVQLRADGFLKFGQRFIFREAALKLACELPGPSARRMDGARQSPDASTRIRRPERQPHAVRPGADLPSMAS